jgi:large subunit ribosomal protein L25
LVTLLDKEKRCNIVLKLTIRDAGKSEEITAMVRDAQINPLSRRLVHVDFLAVDLNAEVRVNVPLVLIGKAVGVTNGGNLHQSMHLIPVAAKPAAIPTKLEVDVSGLDIGDALHASDLKLGEGVRVVLDAKEAIASVVAPKAEKVEEVAAAPVEGAVPAEGAAAAPAAGGAAPAAGAAAAPAAGKKEEKKK